MTDRIAPAQPRRQVAGRSMVDRWARQVVLGRLADLHWGKLTLVEEGDARSYGADTGGQPDATVEVRDAGFYRSLLLGGSVGAAEAYMRGDWTCDDLPGLIRIMVRNFSVLTTMEGGLAYLTRPALRLYHWLRRNTKAGSRGNIYAHYDLGNDFYSLFLDETMTYSCGIFNTPASTLKEASVEKYDRLCRKLDLRPADHVVEVGGGWGGFAVHAATRYGCRVTSTTISQQQYEWAARRVEELRLADRVAILLMDYRDLRGTYDKLVSIEMVEAVGHQYLETFLQRCSALLKPDGLMALQGITIADQHYAQHVRTVDFIKRYIFPGSCLVSVTALCRAATRATDLAPVHLEDITPHYAKTLRRWRQAFFARLDDVRALGFDEPFIRMWDFYLGYCEGAFEERYIGDVQMVFAKPRYRHRIPAGAGAQPSARAETKGA